MQHTLPPETGRIGRHGAWIIPAALRQAYGLAEGTPVVVESRPDGLLLRPAAVPAAPTSAPAAEAWQHWLQLRQDLRLTPEEVQELRAAGRR